MKLNLLPTYVGRGRKLGLSIVVSVIMVLASVGTAIAMKTDSEKQLAKVKEQAETYRVVVAKAAEYAGKAEGVIAPTRDLVRNTALAKAMDAHNTVYPDFYDYLLYDQTVPKIPGFFRITQVAAGPIDGNTVNVSMTGVIRTHQQYVDLMLALLRIPGATTVSRLGFTPVEPFTPGLTEADQRGVTRRPNEAPLPTDPLERLDAMIARGGVSPDFQQNDFGNLEPTTAEKGPMPGYQLVTVTVRMPGNLMTPNPRAALGGAASGGGATLLGGRRGGAAGGAARGG